MVPVEVGKSIVLLRKMKKITQERLAVDSDMSVSYLRCIEHGRANPTLDMLLRLADTLDVDMRVLPILGLSDEEVLKMLHDLREQPEE